MASVVRVDASVPPIAHAQRMPRIRPDREPPSAFRVIAAADPHRSLTALIESEIIPRLMAAHGDDRPRSVTPSFRASAASEAVAPVIAATEIEALAPLALRVEADALLAHVDTILARGVSVDAVLVDLLAPTARRLGEYWEDDRCDFVDVTMALWRLQEIVHELAARAPAGGQRTAGGHRALFASMPGDQHSFGTVVVDELFRRDGWTTERLSEVATPDLLRHAGAHWFDVIGLTVSCDCHIAPLPSILVAVRNVSRNPRVCILVGGRIFTADPALAMKVGADGTARDAKLALKVAADLVRARAEEGLVRS